MINILWSILSISIETIILIGQFILGIIIAVIGYQNYQIHKDMKDLERNNYRHKLFDRRIKIYEEQKKLIKNVMINGIPKEKSISEYISGIEGYQFLFGNKIVNYIDEMSNKAILLVRINKKLINTSDKETGISPDKKKILEQSSEKIEAIDKWFHEQQNEIAKKYIPYLRMQLNTKKDK